MILSAGAGERDGHSCVHGPGEDPPGDGRATEQPRQRFRRPSAARNIECATARLAPNGLPVGKKSMPTLKRQGPQFFGLISTPRRPVAGSQIPVLTPQFFGLISTRHERPRDHVPHVLTPQFFGLISTSQAVVYNRHELVLTPQFFGLISTASGTNPARPSTVS